MQRTGAADNNDSMQVDDGYTTQPNDQPESQESTSSDQEDKNISTNYHFHWLIRGNSSIAEIEKTLSVKSVNINYKNVQGDTALHVAVRQKSISIVDLLVKRGADIEENNHGKTPLQMAKERLNEDPTNHDLKLIHELLLRAQPGPSQPKRPREPNDSDADVPGPKRPKMDTDQSSSMQTSQLNRVQNGQTAETYASSGLRLNFHGPIYQSKLLALFVKRALEKNYEFRLASEMDDAEKFDDIVFEYQSKPNTNEWIWRFVQAKHKKNSAKKKITMNDLRSTSDKNDFSLQKYFISFCKIKSKERFKEANFEDFTIITNTEFELKPDQKKIFEEEINLAEDPILHIDSKKPRKFKLCEVETVKSDLLKLFRSNLFENVLKSKEIKELKFCEEKLTNLKNFPIPNEANELLTSAKEISEQIVDECIGKKRKSKIKLLKLSKDLKKNIEKFLNEKNHKKLFDNLKEIITMLNDASAKSIQEEKYCENIRLKVNDVVKEAVKILNEFQSTSNEYSDLQSEKFRGLESDKMKLFDDETELRYIRENIVKSTDIDWIKEKIKEKEEILTRNDRISKTTINDLKKENDIKQLKKELNEKIANIITEISTIFVALNNDTFKNDFDNFIRQFRIITNYPNEEGLSDILHDELGKEFNLLNVDLVSGSFEREMINFLKEYHGRFYSGQNGREFLKELKQKVGSLMSIGLCESYTEQLENYNIRFRNDFTALNRFLLSQDTKVLHLSDIKFFKKTSLTRLCAIQVFRHLADCGQFSEDDSFIFIRLSMILYRKRTRKFILNTFQSIDQSDQNKKNTFKLCVIECRPECRENFNENIVSEHENELSDELLDIFLNKCNKLKKLILITPYSDTFADIIRKKFEDKFEDPNIFEHKENEVKFRDLDNDSQDLVLSKKVNFQGNVEMIFNQLIDNKHLADQIIDSENLLKLIENKLIIIGDEKPFSSNGFVEDYYIDREFNNQKIPDNHSHKFSEMNLVELQRKVKLLANDSGMGKSTTLTSIAKKIKKISEITWIFRIDLIDYVNAIDGIEFNKIDEAECICFSLKILIRGKVDSNLRLQQELFKACLKKSEEPLKKPPIVLLFDGFDEISPDFNKKVTTLLVLLKETNISQLWITTRPHEEEHLKNELNSPIYYLQPLKTAEQKFFLNKFLLWHLNSMTVGIGKKIRARNYVQIIKCLRNVERRSFALKDTELSNTINDILEKFPKRNNKKSNKLDELKTEIETLSFTKYIDKILSFFAKDNDFHGTPLNLQILVEVVCAENQLLEKFELFYLYNKFTNLRFNIFYNIKNKMKSKNVGAKETRETGENYLNIIHNTLAVKVLFPNYCEKKKLPDFDDLNKFEQEIKLLKSDSSNQKKEKEEKEKKLLRVGLLTKRQERFEFIHHSYAEFFFSKYLMKYLKRKYVQVIFIEKILFENMYSVIRQFVNDQLKKSKSTIDLKSESKEFLHQHKKRIFVILRKENHNKIIDLLMHNGLTEDIDAS